MLYFNYKKIIILLCDYLYYYRSKSMNLKLDNIEKKYLNKCINYVKKEVEKHNGYMPFNKYMQYVLYDNKIGYYLSGRHKIGEKGDFITSPEVSPLFARCIAHASLAVLQCIKQASFLEIGAGLGTFAVDFFIELKNLKIDIDKYYILELSSDLRHVQQLHVQKSLPEFYHCFEWINELPKSNFSGIVFANEVIDAMPVSLFKKRSDGIKSISVVIHNEKLSFAEVDADLELESAVQLIESDLEKFANGYASEINFWVKPWIQSLYDAIDVGCVVLC
ncbi:MAG: SAM-dependent MidA family methyltransferase, partial [Francisellaceae bacterium]